MGPLGVTSHPFLAGRGMRGRGGVYCLNRVVLEGGCVCGGRVGWWLGEEENRVLSQFSSAKGLNLVFTG